MERDGERRRETARDGERRRKTARERERERERQRQREREREREKKKRDRERQRNERQRQRERDRERERERDKQIKKRPATYISENLDCFSKMRTHQNCSQNKFICLQISQTFSRNLTQTCFSDPQAKSEETLRTRLGLLSTHKWSY